MKTLFTLISVFSLTASAKPAFMTQLKSALPEAKNVKCATCHTTGKELNSFGQDFNTVFLQAGSTKESFETLMQLDSDKDAITNYVELLNGTLPGEPGN